MRKSLGATILVLALMGLPATAAPTVEAFARLPMFDDLSVSPGGRYLAARVNSDNVYAFTVLDISGDQLTRVYGSMETDEFSVRWFRWITQEHLFLSVSFAGTRGLNVQTVETRSFVINAETGAATALFWDRADDVPVQIQDNIVSFLPDDPDHILVQYSRDDPTRPHVYRADINRADRKFKRPNVS